MVQNQDQFLGNIIQMKTRIQIGNREISSDSNVFVIAEIGANHNNDIDLAKKMILMAREAGADAVKFQSYKAETLYSKHLAPIREGAQTPYDLIKSIEMSYEWHKILKDFCDANEIIFLSSPFDVEAVDSLEECGVSAYKIASSELGDPLLLKYVAKTMKPVILSTGKAYMSEVDQAVSWIRGEGNDQIILLHCTASYPASYESMNINAISSLRDRYSCLVGLSDHNMENITAVAAVALGAKVIEKHFTISRTMNGPDHAFALEEDGLKELVTFVRKTELAMGSGVKEPDESEKVGRERGNRSIHVKRKMLKGEIIKLDDITIKRPGYGIKGKHLYEIVGRKLRNQVEEDMWLQMEDLENENK